MTHHPLDQAADEAANDTPESIREFSRHFYHALALGASVLIVAFLLLTGRAFSQALQPSLWEKPVIASGADSIRLPGRMGAATAGMAASSMAVRYPIVLLLRCTREEAILKAFRLMEGTSGASSLDKIVRTPVRVLFKDMQTLNKSLANYDALSWISGTGERVIFISEKHRNAPPEALAAMLSHEAMHDDAFNSLSEEVAGWSFEGKVWLELKARNPQLDSIPPGTIPLVDRENQIGGQLRDGTLNAFVRGNAGYQGLPEGSPGFPGTAAHAHAEGASPPDHSGMETDTSLFGRFFSRKGGPS